MSKQHFENEAMAADLAYIHQALSPLAALDGSCLLITGGAGFLGYYLLHYLASFARHLGIKRIISLDNYRLSKPAWLQRLRDQFPAILEVHDLDIVSGDIAAIPQARQADYIIHMASIASPSFYRQYPLETLDANVGGLRRLLDFYRDRQPSGFLFMSSSEVYGDPDPEFIPTDEEYRGNVSSMGPRACYDEAKRFGETLCYVYAQRYAMNLRIVRPFNNFGPGMSLSDRRVPADFANAVYRGEDIVIHSDGSPTRTFCYVADALVGYLKALLHSSFDHFNIGIEGPEISIKQLAGIYLEQAKKVFGSSGEVIFQRSEDRDYLTHNPNRRCPDISKARRLLGYAPTIEVRQGVGRFLRFIKAGKGEL